MAFSPACSAACFFLGINRIRCVVTYLQSHSLMDLPALWWKGGSNTSLRVGQVGWANLRCKSSVEKGQTGFFLLPLLPTAWRKMLVAVRTPKAVSSTDRAPFLQCLFLLFFRFSCPCSLTRHHFWPWEVTVVQSVPEHQQNRKPRPAGDCAVWGLVCFR